MKYPTCRLCAIIVLLRQASEKEPQRKEIVKKNISALKLTVSVLKNIISTIEKQGRLHYSLQNAGDSFFAETMLKGSKNET